ncbi:IclR family transcriptional regulator [Microbispora bryophytorum]|uniref:IclR family transcriptional regulator n=1 Tax=Microbispora bryophytorum TaxID=1460882 RepID=UPI0033C4DECF
MESVRSVTRAAGIVDVVANGGAEGARLMDVVTATGLQKTTVHRILATLTELGWLEQTEAGSFHLGPKLVGLGTEALNRHGIVDIAGPRLAALARTTHDTVFLSTRSGIESLCVDRVLGSFPIRTLTLQVGDRRPLGVGAGAMALLAWLPDDEIEAVLSSSPSSSRYPRPDAASVLQTARTARERGYTVNNGGIVPGAVGVGVPVLAEDGLPIASLSVAAVETRMGPERIAAIAERMAVEAAVLREDLREVAPRLSEPSIRRLLDPHL